MAKLAIQFYDGTFFYLTNDYGEPFIVLFDNNGDVLSFVETFSKLYEFTQYNVVPLKLGSPKPLTV